MLSSLLVSWVWITGYTPNNSRGFDLLFCSIRAFFQNDDAIIMLSNENCLLKEKWKISKKSHLNFDFQTLCLNGTLCIYVEGKSTLPLCISSQPSLWNWMLSTLLSAVNLSLVIWHEGSLWVLLKTVTITSWVYQISKKRVIESILNYIFIQAY